MNPHLNHQKGNSMRICVFCGASAGNHPDYLQAATRLGHALAGAGIGLVYGGASVGLMGRVADAVVIGSRLIQLVESAAPDNRLQAAAGFMREIRAALDGIEPQPTQRA